MSAGIIKGALARLGFQAVVVPEIATLPQCTPRCCSSDTITHKSAQVLFKSSSQKAHSAQCIVDLVWRNNYAASKLREISKVVQQCAASTVSDCDVLAPSREVDARHVPEWGALCWPVRVRGEGRQVDLCAKA